MDSLENVSRVGKWTDSVLALNSNFSVLGECLEKLGANINMSKGLFPSESDLNRLFPNPENGSWAFVGTSFPATIYVVGEDGTWKRTSFTGGDGSIDLRIYTNSEETTVSSLESLFESSSTWICNRNNIGWFIYSGGIKVVNSDEVSYVVRPRSIQFGEEGELLEKTLTDAYLMKFKEGASLISVVITSSDGVTKTFSNTSPLSWTIDKTYYHQIISGVATERNPVVGDTFSLILKFYSKSGDIGTLSLKFKFVL